ncbi:MAG TPA: hypothetical protein VEL76_20190 [Gemmataceae bacterium]|nr:hypothetical protein [Gemmataceae bacterium]
MDGKSWRVGLLAILCTLLVLCRTGAQDGKATDEGKAEEFKGKTFDLKEKGKAAIILTFPADKKVLVTVRSEKKSDVNLFVYDAAKKVVAKDDSPGPDCDLTFTPKEAGKLTLVVVNLGPGENRSTLKVSFGKAKGKE